MKNVKIYYKIGCIILVVFAFFSKCNITSVQAAKLNNKTITVYEGKYKKLRLCTSSEKKITWKSKNKKIATVDKNGKVKGIKQGKTTVTAYQNDKKYSCKVEVLFDSNKATKNIKSEICKDIEYKKIEGIPDVWWRRYDGYRLIKIINKNKFDIIIKQTGLVITTTNESVYDENGVLVSEGFEQEYKNYENIIIKAGGICYIPFCNYLDSKTLLQIQIKNNFVERCSEEYIDTIDSYISVSKEPPYYIWNYSIELESEWGRDINVVGVLIYEDKDGNKYWTKVSLAGRDGLIYKYSDNKLYYEMKLYWYNYGY